MSARGRIAVTAASALALGVANVGLQWSVGNPGASETWGIVALAVLGLTLVGVFVVDRWWAVAPAVSTVAMSWLGSLVYAPTGHWSSEEIELPPALLVGALIGETVVLAAFLAIGLIARSAWDAARRRRSSPTDLDGSRRRGRGVAR